MKRCKDCRRGLHCGKEYHIIGPTCWNGRELYWYARKQWLFWCWWIPKILIITLAVLLCGCVHVKLPDGTEYWRLGEQQIGEVLFTLPDGTEFLMMRQKSTIPVWIVTPAGWQLGEARKVQP